MRSPRFLAIALVLGAIAPLPAGAQQARPSTEAPQVRARALADRGFELFEAGKYAEALEVFREAERHYHAPTLLLMVARTCARLGRLVEARAVYERVLAEPLARSAPRAFVEAQEASNAELAELLRRIPKLQITVTGARAREVTVTLDGVAAPASAEPLPKDPGTYTLVVRVPGQAPVERVVTLEEGRTERLTIDLGHAQPLIASSGEGPPSASKGSLLPAAIAFSVAGVGVVAGAVTGIIAKVEIDDIKSRCTPDGHCLREDQPRADRAQTFITASTIGFAVGGAAAVAGGVLLLLRPGSAPSPASDAGVRLLVGPGSAHLVGRF